MRGLAALFIAAATGVARGDWATKVGGFIDKLSTADQVYVTHHPLRHEFLRWVRDFKEHPLDSTAKVIELLGNFTENHDFVERFNKEAHSYTVALNEWSVEAKPATGYTPNESPSDASDASNATTVGVEAMGTAVGLEALPASLDWAAAAKLPPVSAHALHARTNLRRSPPSIARVGRV